MTPDTVRTVLDSLLNRYKLFGGIFVLMFLPLLYAVNDAPPTTDTITKLAVTPTKVVIRFDSEERKFISRSSFVGDAIAEGGIPFSPGDSTEPFPELPITENLVIEVLRAKPVTIYDEGKIISASSGYDDKYKVLKQLKIEVLDEDIVTSELYDDGFLENNKLGRLITVRRAPRVYVKADGKTTKFASWAGTVVELLERKGLGLRDKDYSIPDANTQLKEGLRITVKRVNEYKETKRITTHFDTIVSYKNKITSSTNCQTNVTQNGRDEISDNTFKIRKENGIQVLKKVIKKVIKQSLKNLIIVKDRFISSSYETGAANSGYIYSGYTTAYKGWGTSNWYGKKILVTNLNNGRQLVVTVVDYGPQNKLLDLSEPAYEALGGTVWKNDLSNVKVQKILCEA